MAISDRITSIEEHIKESYQELEGIGIDTTGVNNNLENIPKLIDGYWETLPKVTEEGTSITLDNTKEGKMKIDLKGNTSQETTTGKNLNAYPYVDTTKTTNGITWTDNGDGTLTVNGTNSGTATAYFNMTNDKTNPITLPAGTYTASLGSASNVRATIAMYDNMTTVVATIPINTSGKTFTLTEETQLTFILAINKELSVSNVLIKPMIETGSTATDYEEYTGGIASPNPDYPQDISVVSGDNEITAEGINLFNLGSLAGTTQAGVTITQDTDGGFLLNGTATGQGRFRVAVVKDINEPITFYLKAPDNSGNIMLCLRDSNATLIQSIRNTQTTTVARYTPATTVHYIELAHITSGVTYSNYKVYPMIVKGSYTSTTIPEYQEYKGATYPISLGVENIATTYKASGSGYFNYNYDNSKVSKNMTLSFMPNFTTTGATIYARPKDSGTLYTLGTIATITSGVKASLSFTLTDAQITEIKANTGGFFQIYRANINFTESSISDIQLTEGSTAQRVTDNPIELCKIGDYQDRIYKDSDKWYIEKQIGKVVLDGTETWILNESGTGYVRFTTTESDLISSFDNTKKYVMSDKFLSSSQTQTVNANADANRVCVVSSNRLLFKTLDTSLSTAQLWKTWLSSNNVEVRYVLATPTTTEITDSTLLSQLEALNGAKSYTIQTNINQENNDNASILNASALSE